MWTGRNSLDSFQRRRGPLTLTLGGLWGPTPFSSPLFGPSFQGPTDLPHPGPPPTGSSSLPAGLGGQRCGPSGPPDPVQAAWAPRAATPTPAGGAALGPRPRPRAAPPAAPRAPRRRPAPPQPPPGVREVEDRGLKQPRRSRKRAPPLPQAGSRLGPRSGRGGPAGASAFLLPAWRI